MKIRWPVLWIVASATLFIGCATATQSIDPNKDISALLEPAWNDAQTFEAHCETGVKEAQVLKDAVKTASGLDILKKYNTMLEQVVSVQGLTSLMESVHPTEDVRKVAEKCAQNVARFESELNLDRDLYDAVSGVDDGLLDAEGKRFRTRLLRDFRRAGVDRKKETRERLAAIQQQLVKLGQDFGRNVRKDVRHIALDSADMLDGMPEDYIKAHAPGKDGKIRITTDYPDFYPFQNYATNSALRRALYEQFLRRGYPANKDILKNVLKLRHEYAGLLGYPSWAAYNSEDKMVKSAEAIERFVGDLTTIARPRSDSDIKQLLERKKKDDPKAKQIEVWDRFFYVGKVRKEQYAFDSQAVRKYLPFNKVKDGIFDLYSKLFDVTFHHLPDAPVWHEDVLAYSMRTNGDEVGRFFLDMHPRANKYKHAAVFPVQHGTIGGSRPVATMVCNFPKPAGEDNPGLMEHTQVVTFFHEFGHLIHHLLGRNTHWVNMSGFYVEWDFVEAPSQLLEEWAWDPDVLAGFAHHHETGESIPRDLVQRMRAANEFGKGVHVMRQLFYTAYSFFMHNRDPNELDLDAYSEEIFKSYSPYRNIPETYVYANFGHLIGYSSMYYTYQWSLVIAKDLYTLFEKDGLLNEDVATRYRQKILEPGGTKDAADLVQDFLGRPYRLDAYKKWLQGN